MSRQILGPKPQTSTITWSIVIAFAIEMLPWGNWPMPNVLAMVLVFWNVYQPKRVGILLAWLLGLLMDVHSGALLGQHALAYSVLSYGAIALHRRLLWYSVPGQALQLLVLFFLSNLMVGLVYLFLVGSYPLWGYVVAPVTTVLLWIPFTQWMLGYLDQRSRASGRVR
jgi:rod shape-determining protein MreD